MTITDERRCELCGDRVDLSPGRWIELRHTRPADAPGLAALYARLRPEDIYRRFFTTTAPVSPWFENWADIESKGGFGLIAVRHGDGDGDGDGDGEQIIAEAGYAKLCDGDGELGIAVDPAARGWLGPWLLDALLRHAAARGVPNIQALVLSDNRRMAAMANARGVATMSSDDWSTTRVSMSTTGRVPSWPAQKETERTERKPRLLVESERSRWPGSLDAIAAGFDVMVCRGPDATAHGCPVVRGTPCPLVEGADVVVRVLDPAKPSTAALVLETPVVHPSLRLVDGYHRDPATHELTRRPVTELIEEATASLSGIAPATDEQQVSQPIDD
ncbi:MAG: hypothetical protein R2733_00950 [Acidimicrobiales bacterium]